MADHNFVSDVASCISAGYGIIGVSSWEEERVEKALESLSKSAKRPLTVWTSSQGFGGDENAADALRHILDTKGPGIFLFKDIHPWLGDPLVIRLLRDLEPSLPAASRTVVLLSPYLHVPTELEKDVAVLDVPLPTQDELRAIADKRAPDLPDMIRDALARAARGLTMRDANRVLKRALAGKGDPVGAVLHNKARLLRASELLEYSEPGPASRQLGGLNELKKWVSVRQRAFTPEAREFGLPEPKGLFLLGVQGCGKSLTAKAVADQWQLPLLRLDVAGLVAGGVSPSEALRRATKVAESMAPSILWIDEIEKGFHGAGEDSLATRALGAFITWMQERESPVFVVATANAVESLPPELLRRGRFDEIFFVDLPDVHDREEILAIHLVMRNRDAAGFDLAALAGATEKFSGAELEQVVVSGLYVAFDEEEDLSQKHLIQCAAEMVPLAVSMEESIERLRRWARDRARSAAADTRRIDFFEAQES